MTTESQQPTAQPQRSEPTCKCVQQGFPEQDCKWHGESTQRSEQQEWTDAYVLELLGNPKSHKPLAEGWSLHPDQIKRVIDAHTAAIANERQRYKDDMRLANKCIENADQLRHDAEDDLLSAQAAIAGHNKTMAASRTCFQIQADLSILHQHDAEVRKPLVDLLEEVLSQSVDARDYPDGPCLEGALRKYIKDALAKVKDSK